MFEYYPLRGAWGNFRRKFQKNSFEVASRLKVFTRIKKEEKETNPLPTAILEVLMAFPTVKILSVMWYFKFSTNSFLLVFFFIFLGPLLKKRQIFLLYLFQDRIVFPKIVSLEVNFALQK